MFNSINNKDLTACNPKITSECPKLEVKVTCKDT